MSNWGLVLFGCAGFVMSILSGIAGAGGGFVMTPLGIFLGLSPAQSVSTGKISGLAVTVGSLIGMKKVSGKVAKTKIIAIMVLAFVVGLFVPHAIRALDNDVYKRVLGIILLLMIPVMVFKKTGIKPGKPGPIQKAAGGALVTVALVLQGVFSGGLGSLVTIALMSMLGMTALEANITKRWSQLILNITIFFGVLGSGLIVWKVAAVGVSTTFVGAMLGGKLAVKHGDVVIMRIMIVLLAISAVALIVS